MPLKGKHALITGGSRGIGRGIALKLAELGVDVAINYVQNKTAAIDTLAQIRERGADGMLVQADVSNPEEIRGMFGKVEAEFSSLDIFISNARPELPAFYSLHLTLPWSSGTRRWTPKPKRSWLGPGNRCASCPMEAE